MPIECLADASLDSVGLDSEAPASPPVAPTAARIIDAAELMRGGRLVLIEHRGALYRLSLTPNDRLVLQK